MFTRKKFENHYEGMIEPFKIIGNVYFVGTTPASSHLIDTGEGLILIDTGYSDTLFLLINSIYKLGFSPYDIRYIIHTHWHWDHTEATAALAHMTGAETMIGEKDARKAERYFKADILLRDGDTVTLGNTQITVMETPGHTEGCISLFFDTEEDGKIYRVGTFGGAGANTLVRECFDYPGCRDGYRESINRLRKERVDVFIGNHVWNNDTEAKGEFLKRTGVNKFVDGDIWHAFLNFCENRLDAVIEQEKEQIKTAE